MRWRREALFDHGIGCKRALLRALPAINFVENENNTL